jgi:HEAT repeat protein
MNETEWLKEMVAKFPTPAAKDGRLAEVDKAATDAAIAELVKGGKNAIVGLVGTLAPAEKGGDSRIRHVLHALVIHAGGQGETRRQLVAEALASTLAGDQPAEPKRFVLQQLQLIGGKEVVPTIGKLLRDDSLSNAAAQALLAIKTDAAEQFRKLLDGATDGQFVIAAHALGSLRDRAAIPVLRKRLGSSLRDVFLTAVWALANIGDQETAEPLLKAASGTSGYDRIKLTQACLLLAENLLAAGKKKESAAIYARLHETRTDDSEEYIREAAAKGLAATK